MACDLCGDWDSPFLVLLEGSRLQVCASCRKYGKLLGRPSPKAVPKESVDSDLNPDFPILLRQCREEQGMSQREFASRIREKESTLRGLESGSLRPTMAQARRLERLLGIPVLHEVKPIALPRKGPSEALTLGDVVRIKK